MIEAQKLGTTTDSVYDIGYWYMHAPPPPPPPIKYSFKKVKKNLSPDKFHQLLKPGNVIAKKAISP